MINISMENFLQEQMKSLESKLLQLEIKEITAAQTAYQVTYQIACAEKLYEELHKQTLLLQEQLLILKELLTRNPLPIQKEE